MSGVSRPIAGANVLNAAIHRPELRSQAASRRSSTSGNRDAPGLFLSWLSRATTVYGYLTSGGAHDVGTPESYAEAQRAFRAKENRPPP